MAILKTQLMLSSIAALSLLLLGIWAASHGLNGWATAIFIVLCAYIIALNVWFWYYVSAPLSRLTGRLPGASPRAATAEAGRGL